MVNEIDKLKDALQNMSPEVQELVKNVVQLVAIQNDQIGLLRSQLQGFMDISGPQFSQLATTFSKAAKNTFSEGDAVKTVSDLKNSIRKSDQWLGAALKTFQIAKEVVTVLK